MRSGSVPLARKLARRYALAEERTEDLNNLNKIKDEAPDISSGLKRGRLVKISARIGSDLSGYVCDRDAVGLLLDVRHPSGVHADYEYITWQSIERVTVEE